MFAATSPLLADIGGVYLKDNDVAVLDDITITADPDIAAGPVPTDAGVTPYAVDAESARRLWELSEQLIER